MNQNESITKLNIDLVVQNPNQPRKIFNEETLNSMATSIKEYGILNPILVRKKDEKYEIIAGERRYRAAKIAGLSEIPVIIKDIPDEKIAEISLIENIQRENINVLEEAESYKEIIKQLNITEKELSEKIGKSQSYISNKIRLLTLPNEIQEALKSNKISERHARSLLTVKDEKKQLELLPKIINEKLTVKELDDLINSKTITEEEIQDAINDILKSLKIEEENEKEEKESDNMNNGNFFPNTNMGLNQNVSLNSMNMQTPPAGNVPQPQIVPPAAPMPAAPAMPIAEPPKPMAPEAPTPALPTFEPTVAPMPGPSPAPVMDQQTQNASQSISEIAPMFGTPEAVTAMPVAPDMPIPTFGETQPAQEAPVEPTDISPISEIMPSVAPVEMPSVPAAPMEPIQVNAPETPAMIDPPLFGVPEVAPEIIPAPTTEMPPIAPTVADTPVAGDAENKLKNIEDYLKTNNINYKLYNNETGHCIIIEL